MLYLWIIALVLFVVIEMATPQLVSIWFAFGALASLIATLLDAPLWLQIVLFLCVSIVMVFVTRPIYKKYIKTRHIPTNIDAIVGKEGIVVEDVNNIESKGLVKVGGQLWSARSEDDTPISKDTLVNVVKIEGVKLIIKSKGE